MPTRPETRPAGRPQQAAHGYPTPATMPDAPPGTDLWLIPLDAVRPAGPHAPATDGLTPDELRRARALRDPVAARRFAVAHTAVRAVLGRYLRRPPAALRWASAGHGKPVFEGELRDWHWNLSRSGGYALMAVGRHSPVGADIERVSVPARAALPLARRFLPPDEAAQVARARTPFARRAAYHRLLARKEACVKAVGGRFLEVLRLPVLRPGPVTVRGARWALHDLPAPPGYVAAVAVAEGPGPLRLFAWPPAGGTAAGEWPC
ncbi:4'-phosphopantetheinyl transferase family protein [Streptomyces tauricus]|uniref:4'-phosphopantetheinyl transferase family protein n=1 Tax=Streptomyces tauricus TaxID=68274 RepID=UPI0033BFB321